MNDAEDVNVGKERGQLAVGMEMDGMIRNNQVVCCLLYFV